MKISKIRLCLIAALLLVLILISSFNYTKEIGETNSGGFDLAVSEPIGGFDIYYGENQSNLARYTLSDGERLEVHARKIETKIPSGMWVPFKQSGIVECYIEYEVFLRGKSQGAYVCSVLKDMTRYSVLPKFTLGSELEKQTKEVLKTSIRKRLESRRS